VAGSPSEFGNALFGSPESGVVVVPSGVVTLPEAPDASRLPETEAPAAEAEPLVPALPLASAPTPGELVVSGGVVLALSGTPWSVIGLLASCGVADLPAPGRFISEPHPIAHASKPAAKICRVHLITSRCPSLLS
jgi:hypothetical protein